MVAHLVDKNVRKTIEIVADLLPDPWEEVTVPQPKFIHPSWQFPLDPKHEIEAGRAVNGILSPATNPNLLQLPAHKSDTVFSNPIEVLLEEELKINASQAKILWEQIRDELTLLWWSRQLDPLPI